MHSDWLLKSITPPLMLGNGGNLQINWFSPTNRNIKDYGNSNVESNVSHSGCMKQ